MRRSGYFIDGKFHLPSLLKWNPSWLLCDQICSNRWCLFPPPCLSSEPMTLLFCQYHAKSSCSFCMLLLKDNHGICGSSVDWSNMLWKTLLWKLFAVLTCKVSKGFQAILLWAKWRNGIFHCLILITDDESILCLFSSIWSFLNIGIHFRPSLESLIWFPSKGSFFATWIRSWCQCNTLTSG